MGIELNFSSFSTSAAVDQQTGKLSLFELLDDVQVISLPAMLPQAVITLVMSSLEDKEQEISIQIDHALPDGKNTTVAKTPFKVPANRKNIKVLLRFSGIPLQTQGNHRFLVRLSGTDSKPLIETELGFNVNLAQQVAHGAAPARDPNDKLN